VGAHAAGRRERRPRLVDTEIDWVIKYRLLDDYATRNGLPLEHPRLAQTRPRLPRHRSRRGLFYLLQRRGRAARVVSDPEVFSAKVNPPPTTRAKLRGDFIRAAQANRRDFTVDWVHLKLNDQAQRTVCARTRFASSDRGPAVERLIEGCADRRGR
jgi:proteasome accessory factor A